MHKVRPIRGIPFGVLPHAQGRHEDFGIRRIKEKDWEREHHFKIIMLVFNIMKKVA